MKSLEVSHREIYDRLLSVEQKVEKVEKNTKDVVDAFGAAAGAFKTLEYLGRAVKPILWLGGMIGGLSVIWSNWKPH